MPKNDVPYIVLSALMHKSERLIEEITVFDLATKCLPEETGEEPAWEYLHAQIESFLEKLSPQAKAELVAAFMIDALIDLNHSLIEVLEESTDDSNLESKGNA